MYVIFTRTGNSFGVKIEADSSDTTEYEQDDKPRTNVHSKRSLNDHKSTNDRDKRYRCTVCDKRFTRKQYLTVHSRIHTREHLYSCSQCEKSFSSPSGLHGHKNIHTSSIAGTKMIPPPSNKAPQSPSRLPRPTKMKYRHFLGLP